MMTSLTHPHPLAAAFMATCMLQADRRSFFIIGIGNHDLSMQWCYAWLGTIVLHNNYIGVIRNNVKYFKAPALLSAYMCTEYKGAFSHPVAWLIISMLGRAKLINIFSGPPASNFESKTFLSFFT